MSIIYILILLATCNTVVGTLLDPLLLNVSLPTPPVLNVSFLGAEGDVSSLYPVAGGSMIITCTVDQPLKPNDTLVLELVNPPRWKASVPECKRIDKNSCFSDTSLISWKFGGYRCSLRSEESLKLFSDVFNHSYVLCNDVTACKSCNWSHPWCRTIPHETYQEKEKTKPHCVKEREPCQTTDFLWCPIGERSVCDIQKNVSQYLVRYSDVDECPAVKHYIVYDGVIRRYNEFFPIRRKTGQLTLKAPSQIDLNGLSLEMTHLQIEAFQSAAESALHFRAVNLSTDEYGVNLDKIFNTNFSDILELIVVVDYGLGNAFLEAKMDSHIIFIDTMLNISIVNKKNSSRTAYCDLAHLRSTNPIWPLIENISFWWSWRTRRILGQTFTFDINTTADIFCHVNVSYRFCQSNVTFWEYNNVSLLASVSEDELNGRAQMPSTRQTEEPDHSGISTETIIYIVSGVIVGSLITAAIAYVSYRGFKKRMAKAIRNKDLQATYNDEANVMDISDVRHMACEVIGSKDMALKVLSSIQESSGSGDAKVETVSGCLNPEVPLLSSTKVKIDKNGNDGLHMTELADYHGSPLFLCQNPTPQQLEKHLNAIWKKRVGTVVISSGIGEEGRVDYFSQYDGSRLTFGKFETYTEGSVKSPGEFDQYVVEVALKTKRRPHKRKITIICIDPSITRSKYAEITEMVSQNQEKKTDEGLPGVLFQGPTGTHHSAALLTTLVGRQMWMRHRRINMLGLLRYVRRNRYGVFSANDGIGDLCIVAGVMQIIATRTEMGNVGRLNVDAQDRDVFDQRVRRQELLEMANSMSSASDKTRPRSTIVR